MSPGCLRLDRLHNGCSRPVLRVSDAMAARVEAQAGRPADGPVPDDH